MYVCVHCTTTVPSLNCFLPPVLLLSVYSEAILVGLTHSIIQDGWTALERACFNGHQKVVELLLGAEANPDLQNKVSTGQDSCVHTNMNSKCGDPAFCELGTGSLPHMY